MLRNVDAGVLNIAFEETGRPDGWPVILLHGFPYDVSAYREVAPLLSSLGARVITPYLRGFGPTTFLQSHTPRSGQQAAIAHDLLELLDALGIESAYLVGYDWGGRAACIVAALWPSRVRGLVTIGSYAIQDIASAMKPAPPDQECPYWYQYYFHCERGLNGLTKYRRSLCRLLWTQWSPTWQFTEAEFDRAAQSFDNADFIDVVIHSYRHRYGLVAGDPTYEQTESQLAKLPPIRVPTIALDGADDGLVSGGTGTHAKHFIGDYRYQSVSGAGHNLPQEKPQELVRAIQALRLATNEPTPGSDNL